MITNPFFPDPAFAWTFYVILVGITVFASYTDLHRLTIPKWLTVGALALGVLFNVLRGGWVAGGTASHGVWVLGAHGTAVGALDGLLFALAGFATGFGLF